MRTRSTHDGHDGTDDRGVSDALAFVITFSIIIASVGLVYGVGFTSLMDIRDGQQNANAQQTFESLATGMNEIRNPGAYSRSGRVELRGSALSVDTGSQVKVTINGTETVYDGPLGALLYENEQTAIGYEGGALFRRDRSSSVMNADPGIECSGGSNIAVISLVVLQQESPSISSTGTVAITGRKRNVSRVFPDNLTGSQNVTSVSVRITNSRFQEAWDREFDDRSTWSVSGNTYTCQADRVYVRVTVIGIEFQS